MTSHGAVLVLEDDTDLARQWRRALEEAGYAVTVTANADDAIDALRERAFSAVVLDMFVVDEEGRFLPRGGLTVMSEIRLRIDPKPPMILVSGSVQFDVCAERMGIMMDAAAALKKPIPDARLVKTVREAIATYGAGADRTRPATPR